MDSKLLEFWIRKIYCVSFYSFQVAVSSTATPVLSSKQILYQIECLEIIFLREDWWWKANKEVRLPFTSLKTKRKKKIEEITKPEKCHFKKLKNFPKKTNKTFSDHQDQDRIFQAHLEKPYCLSGKILCNFLKKVIHTNLAFKKLKREGVEKKLQYFLG